MSNNIFNEQVGANPIYSEGQLESPDHQVTKEGSGQNAIVTISAPFDGGFPFGFPFIMN